MNTLEHVKIFKALSFEYPITVQEYDGEVLAFCNHAGHTTQTITYNPGEDDEFDTLMEVCNKCGAQSEDGEEWYE